jgi:mRNA export factor
LRVLDWASGQSMQLPGAHDAPIRCMRWVNSSRIQALVTGGWDGTLRYWDLRQAQPLATVSLPERCYALDTSGDLLVVGTAERHVSIFNLGASPAQPHATVQSPLRWQTRSIACFPGGAGYAIGSIEGRVAFQYVDEKVGREQNFAYKCHREASDLVYPVNAIAFHPVHQRVLVTAGADGYMHTWDKERRQRLESSVHLGSAVTSVAFNADGSLFAYGLGYDWLKGHEYYSATSRSAVLLHTVQDEFKPKAGLGNFGRR